MKDFKKLSKKQTQQPKQSFRPSKTEAGTAKQLNAKNQKVNVIDDIFKSIKKQKQIKKASQTTQQDLKRKKQQAKLKKQWRLEQQLRKNNEGNIPSSNRTEGGIKIYSQQELNIGKGGNTRLCPINCNCCF